MFTKSLSDEKEKDRLDALLTIYNVEIWCVSYGYVTKPNYLVAMGFQVNLSPEWGL